MAEIKNYYFGPNEVKNFATEVLKKVNVRISDKITSNYDSADTSNALSGKGLNNALKLLSDRIDGLTHLHIETVVGEITSVTDPANDVLYFQKDSDDDPTWVLYIYNAEYENPWIVVGDISIDLVNYWKKTDVEELKTGLGIVDHDVLTPNKISVAIYSLFDDPLFDVPNAELYFNFTELSDGTYQVSGLTRAGENLAKLVVPSIYNGKFVTSIGRGAISSELRTKATEIILPNTITYIGYEAFRFCDFTSFVIPDSVKVIDYNCAFSFCQSLKTLTIGSGIEYIGQIAFEHCPSLSLIKYKGVSYTNRSSLLTALRNNGVNMPHDIFGTDCGFPY